MDLSAIVISDDSDSILSATEAEAPRKEITFTEGEHRTLNGNKRQKLETQATPDQQNNDPRDLCLSQVTFTEGTQIVADLFGSMRIPRAGNPPEEGTEGVESINKDAEKANLAAADILTMESKLINILNRSLELIDRLKETQLELRACRREQVKQLHQIFELKETLVLRDGQVAALSMQRFQDEIDSAGLLEACYKELGTAHAKQLNFLQKLENKYLA